MSHGVVRFQMLDFETSSYQSEVSKIRGHFRGSRFHNVLYYQPLPITRYQVRFCANDYLSNYQKCPLPLNISLS